jgi:hypothetical protein
MPDPETPDADALEQAQPVDDPTAPIHPEGAPPTEVGFETPEADALEQATDVPLDDEER